MRDRAWSCRVLSWGGWMGLAERAEGRANLFGEQLRLLPGGEVAAGLGGVEVHEARERAAGPRLGRAVEVVVRERCDGDGDPYLVRSLGGRADEVLVAVLPVQPR